MTNYRKKSICVNCGRPGHELKTCHDPITSYGIINIDILENTNEILVLKDKFSTSNSTYYEIVSDRYPQTTCYISDNIRINDDSNCVYKIDDDKIPYETEGHIQKFCYYKDRILFMMISRKFSLGFIDFIRGKYDVSDANTIINLFEQMYLDEIRYISRNNYDDILYYFLNRDNETKDAVLNRIYEGRYSNEYCEAKIKFNTLVNPTDADDVPLNLDFYTRHIKPRWKKPEWGFPKGRRDTRSEEDLTCACREFEEETGYKKNEYSVLNKIEPVEERLVGTNGSNYRHIYYLSTNECAKEHLETGDVYEIGDIKWFTYEEAIANIRPYHLDKKRILTRVYLFILNYLIHNNCDMFD